jgi:hypothetical protein
MTEPPSGDDLKALARIAATAPRGEPLTIYTPATGDEPARITTITFEVEQVNDGDR